VVAVTPATFVVMSQGGSQLLACNSGEAPNCGDIVEALVEDGRQTPQVVRLRRLVVPPVRSDGDSLFRRLHGHKERVKELLLLKARAMALIRSFFTGRGFVEWQTPLLVSSPGPDVHLHGFVTHYLDSRGRSRCCYLPTSPELSLKKALCAGMERIFEICRCFRNWGETGPLHQCEFTMLEWYRAYADYRELMDEVEELGCYLRDALIPRDVPLFRGRRIEWRPPWPRTSLHDAFARYCGIDLERGLQDAEYFQCEVRRLLGEGAGTSDDFDSLFLQAFLAFIEPKLGLEKPEILYDYPISTAVLAASNPDQPMFAERFELYVAGVELANAFTELNDPVEQEARFQRALQEKRRLGYPDVPIDTEFLRELRHGMPPAAGIALGVERLLMALTGTDHINDFFFLPHHWGGDDEQRLWPVTEVCGRS
jgi:lysyl-tRNA synthetase class 2